MALIQGFTVWCDADVGKWDDEMQCCAMESWRQNHGRELVAGGKIIP